MILLINVFITDISLPGTLTDNSKSYNRKFLKNFNNLDIFKYSLASLSKAYDWKRVILKISLDENYSCRSSIIVNQPIAK